MRRPQSASGLLAVTASLLVVTLSAPPVEAAMAPAEPSPARSLDAPGDACTAWSSDRNPPATIRVLRTKRSETPKRVAGTVQEVGFRDYVGVVMAVEWPNHYPLETLKAGAVATKQFAWYHVIHPRGRTTTLDDGSEACYDVVDTSNDQVYYPEKHAPGARILKAIDATWDVTVRKFKASVQRSDFFLTGYRAGSTDVCGADRNGWKLFHRSTRACGRDGLKFREILRLYLKPRLEIVTVGRHHVIGSRHGDASAMVANGGQLVAHVWTPGKPPPSPGSRAGIKLASTDLVGYRSSDVDADGQDDLVWLKRTGNRSGRLKVAISNGVGYGPGQTWYDGPMGARMGGARLLVGDFNANGRQDAAILARGESEGRAVLIVFKKRSGNKFSGPIVWWSGALDLANVRAAWAGDVSGDGRADLIVRLDTAGGGVRIRTAVGKASGAQRMGSLSQRFSSDAMRARKTKMVPADANRDGREDLLMIVGGNGRTRVERLQGQALGGFKRVTVWRAPKSDPIPVRKTRLGAADVDYDGMTDLVLYTEQGAGTRIRVLKTRYDRMKRGPDSTESSLSWSSVRPY